MQVTKHQLSVPDEAVLFELKRILASPGFFRASRMQRFLTFVVEGRLAGKHNSDELKESLIGMAVFDRHADYDPKSDPVVRVEARRLRAKLEGYYEGPGKEDAVRIDLPKGSYVPVWDWQREPASLVQKPVPAPALRWLAPGVAATGFLIVLAILFLGRSEWRERFLAGGHLTGKDMKIRSLAVLPFRNLSSDPKQEFLISGLTDEIITDLAKIKNLTVISRTSTDSYRSSTKRLPEIAGELHVDAIVEGTFLTSGTRVRVTAQLIRASTDSHLWAETYERDASDIFALETEIAQDIAHQIGVTLSPQTSSEAVDRPSSGNAYEAYLRGRYFWNKRTLDGLQKSIAYYRKAIQIDPDYANAYAALADSYVLLSSYGGPSPAESLIHARDAAEQALRLDSSLAQAYTALAAVKIDYDWDWQGATKEFKRALELSPSYPTAHHWYALHLSRLGRHKEAEAQVQRALELDPLSLIINTDAGEVFNYARDPDGALLHLRRTLELDPNFAEAHLVLGKVYEQKHDFEQATNEFDTANRLFGDAPNIWALQGSARAGAGKRSEALAIARKLEDASQKRYVSGVDIAIVYCAVGDRDRAMNWLEKAYQNRGKGLNIIGADPLFDRCRSNPRFVSLLKRLQLVGGLHN
jgi:TolB-like protein/Flp pilus assembly protein TadD